MAQKLDTSTGTLPTTSMQEFIELFERTEKMGDNVDKQTWGLLEEVGRRALKSNRSLKRPEGCNPALWVSATRVLTYAAHTLQTKKGWFVLGFLPIIQDVSSGAIERVISSWKLDVFTKALTVKYEHPLTVHGVWVDHDTLQGADAVDLQTLLDDLVYKRDPEPMWHKAEAIACEHPCVRMFYLPVVYRLGSNVGHGFDLDSIYAPFEVDPAVDYAAGEAFAQSFCLEGDADSMFKLLDVGAQFDVIHEAQTERDLQEIKTRLSMMQTAVTKRNNPQHDVLVEIQLTWGAPKGTELNQYEIPAIRFAAQAKNIDDEDISRLIVGVHVDPRDTNQWMDIVRELMMYCFEVGWPNVILRQFGRDDALAQWNQQQTPGYLL